MKDIKANAPFFGLPNDGMPHPHAKPYYTDVKVPHPTNSAAKVVHHAEVMKQVMEAK